MKEMSKLTKEVQSGNHTLEGVNKRLSSLTTRVEQLEINGAKEETFDDDTHPEDTVYGPDGKVDERMTSANRARRILARNKKGMGGNRTRIHDDPYAKVKFTIPSFYGRYDAEEYLD